MPGWAHAAGSNGTHISAVGWAAQLQVLPCLTTLPPLALGLVMQYNSFNGAAHCLLLVPHCFWTGCCFWVLRTPFCVQDGDISCDARLQVVAKAVQGLDSKPRLVARLAASGGLAAAAQHALRLALSCGAEEEVGKQHAG